MSTFDYDLIVIGGGAAGFVSSKLAAGLGKSVAMIEKDKLGGDCTWYGCIPSKALLRAAHLAHDISRMEKLGLRGPAVKKISGDKVLDHVRSVVQAVYDGHRPETFEKAGIRLFFGAPRFIDNHTILIGDSTLRAAKFVLATGSRASVPSIEGLDAVPCLTNVGIFGLKKLPRSIIVLGGGPIGIEMASALNRLGVRTTVVEMMESILFREDAELAAMLDVRLRAEGLDIRTGMQAVKFQKEKGGLSLIARDKNGATVTLKAETVLIAVGRKPNVEGLGLDAAGVTVGPSGVITNRRLRTSAPNIYACGDVAGPYLFSHMAEYQAVIAAGNALLPFKRSVDYRNVVWCTFTDPELAHGGLTEAEARARYGKSVRVYRYEYRNTDRGKTDAVEAGMSKIICTRRGTILGVHILGPMAGEIMHEVQLAKSLGIPFQKISGVIHAYPSYSDVVRQPAKLFYIDRLRASLPVKIAQKFFGGGKK